MDIRGLRDNEIERAIGLVCLAFGKPGRTRFRYHMTEDSSFRPDQARVCVEGGAIVSLVRVSDRLMRIGAAVVRVGAIGPVATAPEWRRRGLSGAVLRDAIAYMEREGYDLSVLFTGIPHHYDRLGWAAFPLHSFSVVAADPPQVDTPYCVRDFDLARDLEAVIHIYDTYNAERTGTMVRPRRYWHDLLARHLGVLPRWVVDDDGHTVAYLRGHPNHLGELAYLPGHEQAVVPVCARAMREAQATPPSSRAPRPGGSRGEHERRITGELPRSHPALALLAAWSPGVVHHVERERMMLRVIRLAPLMQKAAPVLEQRLAQSGLVPRQRAFTVRELGQAVTIVVNGHHLQVEEGKPDRAGRSGGQVALEPGGRNFFRLLLGDGTFSQLRHLIPGADHIEPRDRALLDLLFPQQEPVYHHCDEV